MLNVSEKIKNRIVGSNVLTLSKAIKITLRNGKVIAFTTNVSNVRFIEEPEILYLAKGFVPTAISQSSDMSVGNAESQMIIDNENILQSDLEQGLYNNAYFEMFLFDFTLKENGFYSKQDIIPELSGYIGEVSRDMNQFTTEFRSLSQHLVNKIVDVYKPSCSASFGDRKCKINLDENIFENGVDTGIKKWQIETTVTDAIKQNQLILLNLEKDGDYFNFGIIEFLSGDNMHKRYVIKNWNNTTKVLNLQIPALFKISQGDQVRLYKGCNKSVESCKSNGNFINYRGYNDVPGQDFIASGGGVSARSS